MIAIRIIDDSIKPKLFDAKTNPNPIKKLVININEIIIIKRGFYKRLLSTYRK